MAQRILIIEDEEKIARFIELELMFEGYQVEKACDGRTGLKMAAESKFDLIALDVMLPGLNGIEVLRRIRQTSTVPIIMLTARDSTIDKVAGLDAGANDYLTKPFEIEELLARIRAILRNSNPNGCDEKKEDEILRVGKLKLKPSSREVSVDDKQIDLTKKEFDVLCFLLTNKGLVISREVMLERIWGYDFQGETNAIDVYIRYLRQKIEEPFNMKIIQTIRGVGYVIRDENN